MNRPLRTHFLTSIFFASTAACFCQTGLQAATIPYAENFDSGSAPDFVTNTVNGAGYAAATNRWGVAGQQMVNAVPATDIANTRGIAQAQMTNALSLLQGGMDIIVSTDVSIPEYFSSSTIGIGPRMFTDASSTGSAGNFYGLHGWELNFRQHPTFGSSNLKLAIFDYGGTNGSGTGQAYMAGDVGTGNTQIVGFSFSTSETYQSTLKAHLIVAADTVSGGGLEADANLGKVRLTATLRDPNGDGLGNPFTATITGVSLATLAANSGTGQYFGYVANNVSTGDEMTVRYDNFSIIAVVPEPSSALVSAIALTMMLNCRRLRR